MAVESVDSPQISTKRGEGMLQRRSVAVIGAGAAGLVAAKELLAECHSVSVFEQGPGIGGVWIYTPEVEDDPLSLSPHRSKVHSSMYLSLRTNLPREIMGFLDFPFLPDHKDSSRDSRRYPGHSEVLAYLQDFAQHFNLIPYIRFNRQVTCSSTEAGSSMEENAGLGWQVVSEGPGGCDHLEEVFDAVVVCNGHYFQPKIATIPGIESWPGKQLHSHNYRVAQPFAHQIVVVIGNSSSGVDISREIATVATQVHWAARTWEPKIDLNEPVGPLGNIKLHPMVLFAHEDGTIEFEDGSSVNADVVVHCTGYEYAFPFLNSKDIVKVTGGCVEPLYQHLFPPLLSPFLSFVGLPYKVVPFPLMQLQSRWIAFALSGKVQLPPRQDMMKDAHQFYATLQEKGIPKYRFHDLGSCQFEYNDWLAKQCCCKPLESWRKDMYLNSSLQRRIDPDNYRDVWTDGKLQEKALLDLLPLQRSVRCA